MKNVRHQFIGVCLGLGLFALAHVSVAHAQQAPFVPLPMDYFETAGRVQVQQPINHLTLPGGKRLFDQSDLSTDGAAGVQASGTGNIKNPSGNNVPVNVKARIPNASVAGAIGRAAKKIASSVSGPLGIGVALWELGKEIGFDLSKDSTGELVVTKPDPNVCSVAPCYQFALGGFPWRSSRLTACQDWKYGGTTYEYRNIRVGATTGDQGYGHCLGDVHGISNGVYYTTNQTSIYGSTVAPSPAAYLPSSMQELQDAIALKSGWPSTSAISRAIADSVAATGEKLSTGSPTVSGPATSPGITTTTNNTTNNTTKTETTTHNHTYAGDTVTTTNITNTTVINNTTGDTISNETTTSTSSPEPTADQCKDYPDSAGCAKLGEIPEADELTKKTEAVSVVAVAFAGGSCPPPVSFSVMSQSHSFSYGPLCDRLAVLKFLFLAIAGVLAAYILADSFKV